MRPSCCCTYSTSMCWPSSSLSFSGTAIMSTIDRAIEKLQERAKAAAAHEPLPAESDAPAIAIEAPVAFVPVAPPTPAPPAVPVEPVSGEVEAPPIGIAAPSEEQLLSLEAGLPLRDGLDGGSRINLDFERLAAAGMVTPDGERSQMAEEFRHIKRPLLLNAFGEGAMPKPNRNLLMVTSARPNEGKTFTAINLALSIALERDRTVLLVDADVARPSVARMLDFPGTAGLVDYLADSGRRLADLLASEAMQQLAQELADRYSDRVVVFDSPPLLATTEAAVLAGLMGQVVMVVEAGKTKRDEVKEALALLKPDQFVGVVLNKSNRPFGTEYYYGSYGSNGE